MKTFQALAAAFKSEEVETCFALLGDANMHWAGALADLGVDFVYTRHEHAAVAAATSYARASGKVGCATVTCGPGLTQILTILPIAVRARIPLVIFAGEAPLGKAWYNQGIDQGPFVRACGADYQALHDTGKMLEEIHKAFADAKKDRMPVVLGVPFDLQQGEWTGVTPGKGSRPVVEPAPSIAPDPTEIATAADWINKARRPVVLAGLGVVDAQATRACVALAEKCGALLATTLPAKGLFHDQDFCLGVAGGFSTERSKEVFAEADLVVGIGMRLASHTFDGGSLTPGARVIHIDLDPRETVQGRKASGLQVTSDALFGTKALTEIVQQREGWRTREMNERTRLALQLPLDDETPDGALHPGAVTAILSGIIPPDCHVINTSGHCAFYTAQMNGHPQSHYTVIREFGAIGNGTSFAMGIAAAYPDRPVVLIDGDGSALMHIQELETMKRHDMKILIIVLNDGAYGSEVHKLRADGVSEKGSVFGRPDFAGIGRGFAFARETFDQPGNLPDLMGNCMNRFLSDPVPTIWDIHISDQIASPQILKAHKAGQGSHPGERKTI